MALPDLQAARRLQPPVNRGHDPCGKVEGLPARGAARSTIKASDLPAAAVPALYCPRLKSYPAPSRGAGQSQARYSGEGAAPKPFSQLPAGPRAVTPQRQASPGQPGSSPPARRALCPEALCPEALCWFCWIRKLVGTCGFSENTYTHSAKTSKPA